MLLIIGRIAIAVNESEYAPPVLWAPGTSHRIMMTGYRALSYVCVAGEREMGDVMGATYNLIGPASWPDNCYPVHVIMTGPVIMLRPLRYRVWGHLETDNCYFVSHPESSVIMLTPPPDLSHQPQH